MRTFLKYALIAAATLALMAAAAGLILHRLYPPERIRALVLKKLEAALGREVRLGSASLHWNGAAVADLEVSEMPSFRAGTMLKAGTLKLTVRLLPLITRRRLEVGEVRLSRFEIRARRRKDGSLNLTASKGAAATGAQAKSAKERPAEAVALAIGRIRLNGGTVDYADEAAQLRVRLRDVQADVKGLNFDRPFDVQLALAFAASQQGKNYSGNARCRARLDPGKGDLSRMGLEAKELELEVQGLKLQAHGSVRDFASPKIEMVWNEPSIPLPQGLTLPKLEGSVSLRQSQNRLAVESLKLQGEGLKASASGSVTDKGGKKIPDFQVSAAAKLAALGDLKGETQLRLRVTGTTDSPVLSGHADFSGLAAKLAGQEFSAVSGQADFSPAQIQGNAAGRANQSEVKLSLILKNYATQPDLRLDGSLSLLDLGSLTVPKGESGKADKNAGGKSAQAAPKKTPPLKTSGKFALGQIRHPNFEAGRSELVWDLNGVSPDLSRLNGALRFHVGQGRFDDLKSLATNPFAKLALLPIIIIQKVAGLVRVPAFPAFDRVQFKEIVGQYSFADGVMQIQKSYLDSDTAYTTMEGSADLAKDKLDLHVTTKLPGLGPVAFKVRGTLSNPQVRLDVAAILKQPPAPVQQVLDQGKKLLQGLFK